jgi:selenide, water dikinase
MESNDIRLTQFSPGAGCGCKISPHDLAEILHNKSMQIRDKRLLVGYDKMDDAAVYEIGNGQCIISTTDFFTPIVDDPHQFGRIAAANAMSDVYAMGGSPMLAISILGWPIESLGTSIAGQVIEGAIETCQDAGIPLAGGHSIDVSDPIFGLAVTGLVSKENVRRNDTAEAGCRIFLTKPIGIGIISTAMKKNLANPEHIGIITKQMTELNKAGELFGKQSYIKAMTDVTGFGLLGHLLEMCEGSGLSARLEIKKVPLLPGLHEYIEKLCIPGGTKRNWKSYGDKISSLGDVERSLLCDPQTNGGLLVAVEDKHVQAFRELAIMYGIKHYEIGKFLAFREGEKRVYVS